MTKNEVTLCFKLQVPPKALVHDGLNLPVASKTITVKATPRILMAIRDGGVVNLEREYGDNLSGMISRAKEPESVVAVIGNLAETNPEYLEMLRNHGWDINCEPVEA